MNQRNPQIKQQLLEWEILEILLAQRDQCLKVKNRLASAKMPKDQA